MYSLSIIYAINKQGYVFVQIKKDTELPLCCIMKVNKKPHASLTKEDVPYKYYTQFFILIQAVAVLFYL